MYTLYNVQGENFILTLVFVHIFSQIQLEYNFSK